MDFFMSGEISSLHDDFRNDWRIANKQIETQIKSFIKDKEYGNDIEELTIISIIMKFDEQMEAEGWFKERIMYKKKKKEADIRLRVDYDKFVKGDNEKKKLLLIDNVIKSIREISKKAKKDFRAQELENDILNLFNLTPKDLEEI